MTKNEMNELLVRPSIIILMRFWGEITTEKMMEELLAYPFTFGYCPVVDGYAMDAWEPGTWDDVEHAYYMKWLEPDELAYLMNTFQEQLIEAAHRES